MFKVAMLRLWNMELQSTDSGNNYKTNVVKIAFLRLHLLLRPVSGWTTVWKTTGRLHWYKIKRVFECQWGDPKKNSYSHSMEFHETKLYFIWRYQSSMEFYGIFHKIPWNTCVIWNCALLIPWNPMELGDFLFGDSRVPWNYVKYPMQVQGNITWYWIKWQSQSSMEFHGTKCCFIWRHQSSMEFHGIFHGIPCNTSVIWNDVLLIPWQHMELGDFLFGDSRVQWNSMEYPMEVHGNMVLIKMTISKFHGVPCS